MKHPGSRPGVVVALLAPLLLSSCQKCEVVGTLGGLGCGDCADKARVCEKPTVRALAHDLDELEEHIEKYGSAVAKQPDVWGQARLTKYRQEFETIMEKEKDKFTDTLQGSLWRSDQAYFADAFALSAAVSGQQAGAAPPSRVVVSNANAANTVAPTPLQPPPLTDYSQSDVFGAFSDKNLTRTAVTSPTQVSFPNKGSLQLEPTIHLDQEARFLNHLHELRRINEGDDTADSPGYALNLVRIPVSVLPGKCTEKGHGAEVTMTLTPYLSEELLPTTFRNLVLNDVVDQIGYPVTQFINNPENSAYFAERAATDIHDLITYVEDNTIWQIIQEAGNGEKSTLYRLRWTLDLQPLFARPEWSWVDDVLANHAGYKKAFKAAGVAETVDPAASAKLQSFIDKQKAAPQLQGDRPEEYRLSKRARDLDRQKSEAGFQVVVPVPATKSRRARMPFPPTQLVDVYGPDFAFHLATGAYRALAREPFIHPCPDSGRVYIHLPDVQGYLQEEVAAAQKFLAEPGNADLWQVCTTQLAEAVRSHNVENLKAFRDSFRTAAEGKTGANKGSHSTTVALAWAVVVESALLDEQLVQDMKEAAAAKGCACTHEGWLPYYLPNPPPEARQAFNEYVRCRWPIHVFALDPVAQQQNIADVFSGRREMQLAMSLAFVSGNISARNMMRYARRIEYDFATIDVNGTAIGFSHGDDTFGWRFYPRFQTPDIESNATVFVRDLLIGGPSRDAFLRQRRLEPGMRECLAVVIMPSFVPYATLNVSSDWFKLTNPKCKELDSTDAMKLSRRAKSIQNCAGNVVDADCYRDGDFARLLEKARQLEARLPMQSTRVQVPYENTLGGFAMFNTGVTDLVPELTGWYGTPSINPKAATTVFLVGNHFSVHQTKVIAGGQEVASPELLSRQVMKAVIPAGTLTVGDACQQFVDVHVATPYGVTQHLLIPVCGTVAAPPDTSLAWDADSIEVGFIYGGVGIAPPPSLGDPKTRPPSLSMKRPADVPATYTSMDATFKFGGTYAGVSMTVPGNALNSKDSYEISGDKLSAALFTTFGTKFGPEATNPPCKLTATATLTFKSATATLPGDHTSKPLTIAWTRGPRCCSP